VLPAGEAGPADGLLPAGEAGLVGAALPAGQAGPAGGLQPAGEAGLAGGLHRAGEAGPAGGLQPAGEAGLADAVPGVERLALRQLPLQAVASAAEDALAGSSLSPRLVPVGRASRLAGGQVG